MKKFVLLLFISATIATLMFGTFGCSKPAPAPAPTPKPAPAPPTMKTIEVLRLMGGPVGGTYFVLVAGFSPIIEKYAGIKTSASTGYFSAENIRLLRENEAHITFATADAIFEAWTGKGAFSSPQTWLRTFHTGHEATGKIAARADSGIKTPADLKGKRWIADSPTSPIMQAWVAGIFESYGISPQDVTLQKYVTHPETVAALKEKRADAALITGAITTAAVTELAASFDMVLVPIAKDKLAEMQKKRPYIIGVTIPAKTYKGQTEDVLVLGVKSQLIVHKDLPDEVIYKVIKAILEHPDEITKVHPSASSYTARAIFEGPIVPYHPGVVNYLKEKGFWTAQMEAFQKEKLAVK